MWRKASWTATAACTEVPPRRVFSTFLKRLLVGTELAILWPVAAMTQVSSFKPGVVKIMVSSPALRSGAGFVVAQTSNVTYIVTASHVVEGADKISVQFFPGDSAPVSARTHHVEAGNPQGMALLEVSGPVPAQIVLLPLASESTVSGGEAVTAIGHQASTGDWGVITGTVSSRKGREIVIQAPIEEQASGGPVLRDDRVLGLVVSTRGNFGYAITARAVQDYIEGFGVMPGRAFLPPTAATEKPVLLKIPKATPTFEVGFIKDDQVPRLGAPVTEIVEPVVNGEVTLRISVLNTAQVTATTVVVIFAACVGCQYAAQDLAMSADALKPLTRSKAFRRLPPTTRLDLPEIKIVPPPLPSPGFLVSVGVSCDECHGMSEHQLRVTTLR